MRFRVLDVRAVLYGFRVLQHCVGFPSAGLKECVCSSSGWLGAGGCEAGGCATVAHRRKNNHRLKGPSCFLGGLSLKGISELSGV